MRILIVSANFNDLGKIGSRRPRSLAKWLASFGHEVTVVTQVADQASNSVPDVPGIEVVVIDRVAIFQRVRGLAKRMHALLQSRGETGASSPEVTGKSIGSAHVTARSRILSTLSLGFRGLDDFLWAARAARRVRKLRAPEIVFSTYGPLSSLWLGRRLARLWPTVAWVADFRDLVRNDSFPASVDRILAAIQRDAVLRAKVITTVSRGLHDGLVEGLAPELGGKVHVLPNGFEPSPLRAERRKARRDRTLRIGYTGNMYAGRRDASALFQAVRELIDRGSVAAENVEVHYAGKGSAVFLAQAARFGVVDLVVDHGFVDAEEALAIQEQSDILLVLSWNTRAQQGVLTGKVFEYLAAERPILALTAGDLAGAELTELIDDLGLGFAFEYANGEDAVHLLKGFLLGAYADRRRGVRLSIESTEVIRPYEYEQISRRLEELFQLQLK